MGRFPSIAASKQKTGAAKAKLYSMYAKEIYQAAKTGGTELNSNLTLKRIVEKAKSEQIPSDIIKRAIDKVNSGVDESYMQVSYELFGPSGSNLIVECLTDNVNRSISSVRAALNKTGIKMGAQGSVSYMYDNLCIVSFKGNNEEEVLNALIEDNIEIEDLEFEEDTITIYGNPQELYRIKETISNLIKNVEFEVDEISFLPKDTVTLIGEDLEDFQKMINLLDEIDDVQKIYHNVKL
ncbi:MAG: YebC/PmpR family DNA-binding transcriptional regulator [Bacilli bacterium]|nr:YebC/PmpR family DNA-binding transcriptional regulator [Bacilli bacterium]MDD4733843.1 YebC/PmpR family DNA-binding transcriptional regulator [Bacilli bacterium]